ncbi:MAG: SDR family oxidoreductase [Bacteroidota bacterium]
MRSYHSRTVLVTGASGGIGEAMARQLARDGARLLLTARSEDTLHRLADELRVQGAEAEVFAHDLGTPGAAQGLFDRITEAGHALDVLVNNAGFGKIGTFMEYEAGVYEGMVTLNVTNLVTLTRLALPGMLQRGTGGVLNVASTAAFQPVPYFAVYAATKAFVKSFTEALHAEVGGTGVAVTCLCPGPTDTGFFERADMDGVPGGRAAETPEKVARVGLEALLENEHTVISGLNNKVMAAAARFAPTKAVLAVGKKMMQEF